MNLQSGDKVVVTGKWDSKYATVLWVSSMGFLIGKEVICNGKFHEKSDGRTWEVYHPNTSSFRIYEVYEHCLKISTPHFEEEELELIADVFSSVYSMSDAGQYIMSINSKLSRFQHNKHVMDEDLEITKPKTYFCNLENGEKFEFMGITFVKINSTTSICIENVSGWSPVEIGDCKYFDMTPVKKREW